MNSFRSTLHSMKELCKATVACSKALNGLNKFELQMRTDSDSASLFLMASRSKTDQNNIQMPSGGCS